MSGSLQWLGEQPNTVEHNQRATEYHSNPGMVDDMQYAQAKDKADQ